MAKATLLIGGNGFIGQALARRLAERGETVTVLCRRRPPEDIDGVLWQPGDLEDVALLGELLAGSKAVVHLATTSTPGRHPHEPAIEAQENLLPLLRLIECLNRHPELPLVYLSSGGAIYGNPHYLPVDEGHVLAPLSYHAAGKAAAEQFLGVHGRQGHTVTVLRPANVYGPGQPLAAGFGIIRTLLEHLHRGTPLTLWGDGEAVRDYLHIDDMVDACIAVLDRPETGTFNVGSGSGLSLNALCQLAAHVTGRRLEVHRQASRGIDVQAVTLDCARFNACYGWRPRTGIEAGLLGTWEWLIRQA
jgi:UDP-glucose 4-epimerase